MNTFKRQQKYLVLKLEDIADALSNHEQAQLGAMIWKINAARTRTGKKENNYVVVNEDEPYAEEVWALIQQNVESAQ